MTLYLKYRPKNLNELDLKDVGQSLKNILSKRSIPHAFLFAGPKGTGKTSAARILAKIVNCESKKPPCGKCQQCVSIDKGNNLDVIEMDAASHRGIDDVRTLRDAVKLTPVAAKKKIYIIDEAHMLTTEASNALLKTLEEPPEHVIFILATTNPEKLIETIRSRTTFIPFRKANTDEIVSSLKRVISGEKIKIKDDTLSVIAEASGGSFRDGIKILEQLLAEEKELTKEYLEEFLFSKKSFDCEKFISLLIAKDTKNLITEIGKFNAKGVTIENFLGALLADLRRLLLIKVGVVSGEEPDLSKNKLVELIELLDEAQRQTANSLIEEMPLEIAVIKWCSDADDESYGKLERDKEKIEEKDIKSEDGFKGNGRTFSENKLTDSKLKTLVSDSIDDVIWKNILELVKPVNASIEALLRAAKPLAYDGKVLMLGVYYKFHKERLEDVHHRLILEEIVAKVLGSPTKVSCTLVDPPPRKIIEKAEVEPVLTEGKDKDIIKAAEEIFGN